MAFSRTNDGEMRLPGRFIRLVMSCVTFVSYSLLIRGKPFGSTSPIRGLRQGDPIFPYLFLILTEGFSTLLQQAERRRLIHGVSISREAPSISHLLYVDDSLLFDATLGDSMWILHIFNLYEAASGQKINYDKSAMCFSPYTPRLVKEEICELLQIPVVPCHERYLGLPTLTRRNKKKKCFGLLRTEFGSVFMGGKVNFSLKEGNKFLLKW